MRAFFALVAIVMIGMPVVCLATVNLGAGIQSQSPDGRLIELNGAITSDDANILGWIYDWGNGEDTGWFPMLHRYSEPSTYTIRLTGYDDAGGTAEVEVPYEYIAPPPSDISFLLATPDWAGLKCGDSLVVGFRAQDSLGTPLSLAGRTVSYYSLRSDLVDARVQDSTLVITAKDLPDADYGYAYLWTYVDGVEADPQITIIVNKNPGSFVQAKRCYIGLFLPDTFFTASDISVDEFLYIGDLAYAADLWSVHDKCPNQGNRPFFQGISYSPQIYEASGNPMGLGDYAIPQDGRPKFDAVFHELGRNFSGVNQLFNCIGTPGPFYVETAGEWYVQYDFNNILSEHASEISPLAVTVLESLRDDNRANHLLQYQDYVNGGCQFNYYDMSSTYALVEKIYEYCDTYGWTSIRRFMDFFDQGKLAEYASILTAHGGITDETNRVTFMLAALTYTFVHDVRPDFAPLNFPVDDSLFNDLMALWGAGVKGPGPGAPGGETQVVALYQNRPNPAAGTTEITYWLPRETEVELALYDVRGRAVSVIDRGVRPAGLNRAEVDGSNLSPGVYLYRLVAGQSVERRKLVIAR